MGRRDKPVIIFTETQLAGQAAEQLRKEKDLAKRSTAKAISLGLIKPLKSSEVPRDFFAFAAKDATLRPGTADSSPNPYDPSKFDTAQIEKPTCNKCKKDGARCLHGTAGRAPPLPKQKYVTPITSSQDYGWREPIDTMDNSGTARRSVIQQSFFRGTGVSLEQ